MSLIFDALVVIILLGCVSTGAKQGLVKTISIVLASVVAILGSAWVSAKYSQTFYEELIEPSVSEKITDELENFDSVKIINEGLFKEKLGLEVSDDAVREAVLSDGELGENLFELANSQKIGVDINEVLEYIDKNSFFEKNNAPSLGIVSDESYFEGSVRILANDNSKKRAEAFYKEIAKPYLVKMTKWAMTFVLFLISFTVLKFLIVRINILDKIPVAGFLNTVLGGALGCVEGFVAIFAISIALKICVSLLGFDTKMIDDTTLFKLIYNIM